MPKSSRKIIITKSMLEGAIDVYVPKTLRKWEVPYFGNLMILLRKYLPEKYVILIYTYARPSETEKILAVVNLRSKIIPDILTVVNKVLRKLKIPT